MALTQVNSAGIEDGSIVNADIKSDAIIAGSKLVAATTSVPGSMSAADKTKLDAIEASADVTDATNVNAAGAIMHSDLGTKGQIAVGDGSGDATILTVGSNDQVLTADSGEASGVKWAAAASGGATINNATANELVTVASDTSQLDAEPNLHVVSNQLLIGHNTSCTDGGDLQVHGVGDARVMDLISNRADVEGPRLRFSKSRVATGGDYTLVQDDDYLGKIEFAGADGTDYNALGAIIQVRVDGTPGSNDMPGRMEFHTTADGNPNPIERMTIDSTGNVTVKDGNLVIGTAGHGIDFSATSHYSTSGDGEVLTTYEEGTWTPAPMFGGGNTGMAKSVNGTYVRVGKSVTAYYQVIFTDKGSSTGTFQIGGFPFSNSQTEYTLPSFGYFHRFIFGNDTTYMITCNLSGTTSSWRYAQEGTAGTGQNMAAVTEANVSSAIHVAGALNYRCT